MGRIQWPEGKSFAFTIVDDTDNATVENIRPIYELLYKLGFKTTKTVWVYPPRDKFKWECLLESEYLELIKDLKEKGFEIGLHNIGSGSFTREEIIKGIDIFYEKLGEYPMMHVNHSGNADNIYWGTKRFSPLIGRLYKELRRNYSSFGEEENSKYFWGDVCKDHIKYIRNRVFSGINTLEYDPKMPHYEKGKEKYSNYWFSSSNGSFPALFNDLITKENVDKLENENGCSIVYTHFASGFVSQNGEINHTFKNRIEYLSNKNGWFVPASRLLDYLLQSQTNHEIAKGYMEKLDYKWLIERTMRRLFYNE